MIQNLIKKIEGKNIKIVFTEGMDERVVAAARQLKDEGIMEPIIIGSDIEINKACKLAKINIDGIKCIDPKSYAKIDGLIMKVQELRKGKWTFEECKNNILQYNYFGTALVANGDAHGVIGGATYSTADTIRPALQLIKTKNGAIASSYFVMIKNKEKLLFADCAINIDPDPKQLAEIAAQTANSAKEWGLEPKVAMLSFSTKGSGKHELVEKVENACEILKSEKANFEWDGTLQFDAAYNETTANKKAPLSKVAGKANVYVFPDLNAGNIGYKIAQRMGGYEALGPVMQGLNKPCNDLSRGCSINDIYNVAIITANQE